MPTMRKWLGPALVALVVVVAYQWLVAPVVADMRDDWTFLHLARVERIRQIRQQEQGQGAQK